MWMAHCAMLLSETASASYLVGDNRPTRSDPAPEARAVVAFWKEAGPSLWFAKNADFDRRFRERFAAAHETAARGDLDSWLSSAEGALALCLLLDQYPRNAFRGTKRMYESDEKCRSLAQRAIVAGYDLEVEPALSLFLYLPFAHSESLADQERSVALCQRLGPASLQHAEGHRDIVKRFGRFPHRNPILGRRMTPDEQRFLDEGGYSG
jgi:uncharacterized protein (DUF924 family)